MQKTKRRLWMCILGIVSAVTILFGTVFVQTGGGKQTVAEAASLETVLSALEFVNDFEPTKDTEIRAAIYALDDPTKNTTDFLGKKSTFQSRGIDSQSGEFMGYNSNFPDSLFYFNKSVKNASGFTETQYGISWEYQGKSSNVTGPYRIQTPMYLLKSNGKMYLPYFMITLTAVMKPGVIEVYAGKKVTLSELIKGAGGNTIVTPTIVTQVYLPVTANWLQYDANGKPYFTCAMGAGKYYIAVNGNSVGITTDENDPNIASKNTTIPAGEIAQVTEWEYQEGGEVKQSGTYDGTSDFCPIEPNSVWTVDVTQTPAMPNGAGEYRATVTPQSGYVWEDGTSSPKTVAWSVGKATRNVTAGETTVSFGMNDKQKNIPLNVSGLCDDLAGATVTVKKNGETSEAVTGEIVGDSESGYSLRLDRNTLNAEGELSVELVIPASDNFEETTLTLTVNLDGGAGFYLDGATDKIYATLDEALQAASGAGATVHVRGNAAIESTVTIPDNVTLVGDTGSSITAGELPLFRVESGKSLAIEGISLSAAGKGALIESAGALTVKNCALEGGISVTGGTLTFDGNTQFTDCATDGNGGALNITGGTVTVPETASVTMTGCTATEAAGCGGSIYVGGGTFTAEGMLSVNSGAATDRGGALYVAKGANVSLGEKVSIQNNAAAKGDGVYVEDGAKLTLSMQAAGVTDGIMLGYTATDTENAQIELNGTKPEGRTIAVEFESPEAQSADGSKQYVTTTTAGLNESDLKDFMRVKNPGYTFDPQEDGTLHLTDPGEVLYAVKSGSDWSATTTYDDLQEAISAAQAAGSTDVTIGVIKRTRTDASGSATDETDGIVELLSGAVVPRGMNVTLTSVTRNVGADGTTVTYTEQSTPNTLKRHNALTGAMITVEEGGSLTVKNVILDGGATWEESPEGTGWSDTSPVKIKDDSGKAGTVVTNNSGVTAHAPILVNEGELTLESGATLQNNDNNWAAPGVGFGSQNYGGGVRNEAGGKLTMKDGSTIRNCYSREGGAIMNVNKPSDDGTYAGGEAGNDPFRGGVYPTVAIEGGTIQGNVSQTKGAAVQNIYGNAQTVVSGGNIQNNFSLHDLGVLTVEEGASLTVSGGSVSAATNANALYLYNQYSADDYANAQQDAKPFIEGARVGSLTVSNTPSITGKLYLDPSCAAYTEDSPYYDTFVDVTGYTGSNKLVLGYNEASLDKLAKGTSNLGDKIEYTQKAVGSGNLTDSYTVLYSDGESYYLAQGGFDLAFAQSELNKLTVTGVVDGNCTGVTVTVGTGEGAKQFTLTPKDGVIEAEIDLTAYAESATSGDLAVSLSVAYGETNVEETGVSSAAALRKGNQIILPAGATYLSESEGMKTFPTDGTMPEDLLVDDDGNATFAFGDTQVSIAVGKRAAEPELVGKVTVLKGASDSSLTLALQDDANAKYEYRLRDGAGNETDWVTPENGVLTFEDLAAAGEYTLYAREPASDLVAGKSLRCADDTYTVLTTEQNAKKGELETAINACFTDGALKTDATSEQIEAVMNAYAAFEALNPDANVLALYTEAYEAGSEKYDETLAQEWLETYKTALIDAENYLSGDTSKDATAIRTALETADTAFNGAELTDGARAALLKLLDEYTENGAAFPLRSPLAYYKAVAAQQMQENVAGLDDALQAFGETFLATLGNAESVAAVKQIEANFEGAQTAAQTVKTAYDTEYAKTASARGQSLLDRALQSLYAELAAETSGDYNSITSKVAGVFALAAQAGLAQDRLVEAFGKITGRSYDDISSDDYLSGGSITDPALWALMSQMMRGMGEIENASDVSALNAALKETANALLDALVHTDGGNITDSKAETDIVGGVKAKIETAVREATDVADLTAAFAGYDSVAAAVEAQRATERETAIQDYKDAYEAITGEAFDEAAQQATLEAFNAAADCAALNKILKERVDALLTALLTANEASSETAKGLITAAQAKVATAYETAEAAAAGRTLADLSAQVTDLYKEVTAQNLADNKAAAEAEFSEVYDAIVGAPADAAATETKNQAVAAFRETLTAATNLEELNAALKAAAGDLLDGYAEEHMSSDVAGDVAAALQAQKEKIAGAAAQATERGEVAALTELAQEAKAALGAAIALADVKSDALSAYQSAHETLVGALGSEAQAAQAAIEGADSISAVIGALQSGLKALLDVSAGDYQNVDSVKAVLATHKGNIDGALNGQTSVPQTLPSVIAAAKAAISAAIQGVRQGVKDALDALLEEKDYTGKTATDAGELLAAAKQAADGADNASLPLIEEKLKAQFDLLDRLGELNERAASEGVSDLTAAEQKIRDGIEAVGGATSQADVTAQKNGATLASEKEFAKQQLKELTDGASDAVKGVLTGEDGFNGKIEAAGSVEDVGGFVTQAKSAIEGEKFLDDNAVLRSDFASLDANDKAALEAAQKDLAGLGDGAKAYLAAKDGYDTFAGEIEDKINKTDFEAAKDAQLAEAEKLVRAHDDPYVRERYEDARAQIGDVTYAPQKQTPASGDRSAYLTERKGALGQAYSDTQTAVELAQYVVRKLNEAQTQYNELAESGNYSASVLDPANAAGLAGLRKSFEEEVKTVPAAGKDGKTGKELVDGLYRDMLDGFADVPMQAVTAGGIKADGSSKEEGGTGDYAEGDDSVWGIVTNDAGLPGSSSLSIEQKDGIPLSDIDKAAKDGKLVAAEGSGLSEDEVKDLVSGKKSVSSFHVSLLAKGNEVTEFHGSYRVRILLPEDMRDLKGLSVVGKNGDSVEVYNATRSEDGKYLEFTATRLTEFGVLADDPIDLLWLVIVLTVVLVVELIALAVLLIFGKSKKDAATTASVAPIGLLAAIALKDAIIVCAVLAVLVAACGVGIGFAVRAVRAARASGEKENSDDEGEV